MPSQQRSRVSTQLRGLARGAGWVSRSNSRAMSNRLLRHGRHSFHRHAGRTRHHRCIGRGRSLGRRSAGRRSAGRRSAGRRSVDRPRIGHLYTAGSTVRSHYRIDLGLRRLRGMARCTE